MTTPKQPTLRGAAQALLDYATGYMLASGTIMNLSLQDRCNVLRTALADQLTPAQAAPVVAWRYRNARDTCWIYQDHREPSTDHDRESLVRESDHLAALNAARAEVPAAPVVKRLRAFADGLGLYGAPDPDLAKQRLLGMADDVGARVEELERDAARLDWLEKQLVEVRSISVHGSMPNFFAQPDLEVTRSQLRQQVDAAIKDTPK